MKKTERIVAFSEAVKVVPITTDQEFFGTKGWWNPLLQESQSNTVFLTWEWLTAWWKAYADLLPVETRTKTKHGFGLPIPVWLRTDTRLNEMMHDLILSSRSVQRGYFQKKALEELVKCHKTDETSFYGTALWNLMILELWQRTHGGLSSVSSRRALGGEGDLGNPVGDASSE